MGKIVRNVKKPDIYSSIIPIYYLSKLTGLASLSLASTYDKQNRVGVTLKTSVCGVAYTVILIMGIIGGLCSVVTFYRSSTVPFGSEGSKHVLVSESLVNGIACISSLAVFLTRIRKEMDRVLYKISVIDTLLETKYDILRRNHKYQRMQVTLLVIIIFIVYVNDFVALNTDIIISLCLVITYVCTSIKIVTILQFVNLVFLLRQKFKILNSYLASTENPTDYGTNCNLWDILLQTPNFRNKGNFNDDALHAEAFYQALNRRNCNNITIRDSTAISIQNSSLDKEKFRFRALRIIWDVLFDISSSVNSMYGLQILLCIVSAFIEATTNSSYSIITIHSTSFTNIKHYHHILSLTIWALMQFLLLFWITASCNATSGEANRSVNLLQKLLLQPDFRPDTAAEIQLFLQQVRDLKVKFTAWDIFTINHSLLGSTVGAIVTFLVLLVQFQAHQLFC
jgi:hypothetical protein